MDTLLDIINYLELDLLKWLIDYVDYFRHMFLNHKTMIFKIALQH